MSEIRLTEAERDELALACDAGCGFGDAWVRGIRSGLEDMLLPSVEAILAARLAKVEALADQWNTTPDYTPSEYDQGRVDQRHAMTGQLLGALSPREAAAPTSGEVGS